MERVISDADARLYDKFVKKIQELHGEMFTDSGVDQKIMSLYIGAMNMIGNIYKQHSAKDKKIMLRSFVSDVRNNFRSKNG